MYTSKVQQRWRRLVMLGGFPAAHRTPSMFAKSSRRSPLDDGVDAGLRDRLAALDRALQRVEDGSCGRSIRSGAPIRD
jgi:hypothetical protein